MKTSQLNDKLINKLVEENSDSKQMPIIRIFDELDSTSEYLKRLIAQAPQVKPMIVLAETQTSGHGKRGRDFYSPAGTGIYMSILIPQVQIDPELSGRITIGAAMAVIAAINNNFSNVKLSAKWVNDILFQGRKIGGILAEMITDVNNKKNLVLGIGINLNTQDFPNDLKGQAGSLTNEVESGVREAIISETYLNFIKELGQIGSEVTIDQYRQVSDTIGRKVEVQTGNMIIRGIAKDIDNLGNLVVELNDGQLRHIVSGDVLKVNATH